MQRIRKLRDSRHASNSALFEVNISRILLASRRLNLGGHRRTGDGGSNNPERNAFNRWGILFGGAGEIPTPPLDKYAGRTSERLNEVGYPTACS